MARNSSEILQRTVSTALTRAACLIALLWGASVAAADGETLSVDQVLEGVLSLDDPVLGELGFSKRYRLAADVAGTVTLTLDSYDFDARIVVIDADGNAVVDEDGGGIESNARLVYEAGRDLGQMIAVTSTDGRSGRFRLAARRGDVPAPTGARAAEIQSNFYREYARRRLELAETDPEPRPHRERALEFLLISGNVDRQLGRFDTARASLERACEIADLLGDSEQSVMAGSLLGAVLRRAGDPEEAIRRLESLLDDVRASRSRRQLRYLVLDELGNAYLDLEDHAKIDEASACFSELLELTTHDEDRERAANTHLGLARLEEIRGSLAAAREQYGLALAALRDVDNEQKLAGGLGTIGHYHSRQSDYSEARACYEEALGLLGPGLRRARIAGALANVFAQTGRYGEAARWYEESLVAGRIAGNAKAERHAMFGIANMRSHLGHRAEARDQLRDLLSRARRESAPPTERARILDALAEALRNLGEIDAATKSLQDALTLFREADDPAGEALVQINIGRLLQADGQTEEARAAWDEALRIATIAEHAELRTRALANLTYLDLAAGNWDLASRNALEAVANYRQRGLESQIGSPLLVAAKVALKQARLDDANRYLDEAMRLLDRPDLRMLEFFESSAVRAGSWDWSQVAADLTARRIDAAPNDPAARNAILDRGFSNAGLFKGRALLEGIAEHRAGQRSAETIRIRRARKDATVRRDVVLRELAAAMRAGADPDRIDALREEAEDLAARVVSLREELQRVAPRTASVEVPVGIEPRVLRDTVLAEGDRLIDYVSGETNLYAFVVTRDESDFVDLGEWASIENDLRSFMNRVTRPTSLGNSGEIARQGSTLYDRLLRPLLPAANGDRGESGVGRLIIVPNTGLSELSFEALVADIDEQQASGFDRITFVLDRYDVIYSPSSPVLAFLAGIAPREEPGRMLVLADPIYASESHGSDESSDTTTNEAADDDQTPKAIATLMRLQGTREEAISIAAQVALDASAALDESISASIARLREHRSGSLSLGAIDIHLGRNAGPAVLRGNLRDYSILHFATHGVIDPHIPDHSGIALSAADDHSGFLSLTEILDFDLDADLTVLSACQTARGRVTKGEGVQSLAAACLFAGSRGVIASLWKVSDLETQQLMQGLYRSMRDDASDPATALRRAKLALRRGTSGQNSNGDVTRTERGFVLIEATKKSPKASSGTPAAMSAHPYFWAPFIYVGKP